MSLGASEFIRRVLQYEEDPPGEQYTLEDFSADTAAQLSIEELKLVVREALRKLPFILAGEIARGLLRTRPKALSSEELYDEIPKGRHIDTAAQIVDLLVHCHDIDATTIARELLRRLSQELDDHAQNCLAFGLWVLYNGMTCAAPDWEPKPSFSPGPASLRNDIDSLIRNHALSEYARETLKECSSTW